MNNSRTPRVAGDFAGFVGAEVRLLLYIAATQCYHARQKRPDPGKKKKRNKKCGISIYKSMREYPVTLPEGHQDPLTYKLPLHNTDRASCSPTAQRCSACKFAWWALRNHSRASNQSGLPDCPSPTVAFLIHTTGEPPMMLVAIYGTAILGNRLAQRRKAGRSHHVARQQPRGMTVVLLRIHLRPQGVKIGDA